eukprot:CAMPEP_0176440908 /NCGR_PEP_ID=MMETSP0127-20121128/20867_1 /TAXON_ID=938130 /ORGANISM="Platyophrya macrostoma, Strain WH" /LENGTH=135 /DNA_ID=CAMNT_0017825555 /DNA_START=241 /DNA_END=645 /DNA_ORIENTATION=+
MTPSSLVDAPAINVPLDCVCGAEQQGGEESPRHPVVVLVPPATFFTTAAGRRIAVCKPFSGATSPAPVSVDGATSDTDAYWTCVAARMLAMCDISTNDVVFNLRKKGDDDSEKQQQKKSAIEMDDGALCPIKYRN